MPNDGKAGSILQSLKEIGTIVGSRVQQKAADNPLVSAFTQGAGARIRPSSPAEPGGRPADVVSVTDREPGEEPPTAALEPHDTALRQGIRAVAAAVPQLLRLLWRLARDPRVPAKHKAILGAATVYLVSPVDIIPDRLAGLGQLDDFAVLVSALDIVLNQTPAEIVHEHWAGDPRTLDTIRRVVGIASHLRGGKVRRWLLRDDA